MTNECLLQRCSQKFRNGDDMLIVKGESGRKTAIENEQLNSLSKPIHVLADELDDWNDFEPPTTKKLDKWVSRKKNRGCEGASSLILCYNNDFFYRQHRKVRWKMDFVRPPVAFVPMVGPRSSFKRLREAKIEQKTVDIWWSAADVIYQSFFDPDETFTTKKYCPQIAEMHQKLRQHQSANRKGPIFLHHSVGPYIAQSMPQSWSKLGCKILPPYSPNLSPNDYHFFKYMDIFLHDKRFKNQDNFIAPEFYTACINKRMVLIYLFRLNICF